MKDFTFYAPTKIVFGKNAQENAGKLVSEFGGTKVLIHYGSSHAEKSGLLDQVCQSLQESGISYVKLGGVLPNPRLSMVYRGIELYKKENADFILAVGGGSVIDSCKAIGMGVANPDCDIWDFYSREKTPKACAPIGTILTIAAAGSEMSESSVITKDEGALKRSCSSDFCRAKFSIMNPELTSSLPPYQTSSGIVDILMHTLERYFHTPQSAMLNDSIAEALMRTVIANAKILMENPADYDARAEIMWASTLSHNDITGSRWYGDWSCHQLEHELSGMFDVAHGAGLAALWGTWARYVMSNAPERFACLGKNVFGINPEEFESLEERAEAAIIAMENFFRSINMPVSISDMGINLTVDQIKEMALKCSFNNTRQIGTIRKLNMSDMETLLVLANAFGL